MYQGAIPALIPFFVAERQYGYAAATGIMLATSLLSSVAQPIFGVLTDRYRWTWLVAVGIAVAGTGVGLVGIAPTYELTLVAVAVSGLGVAAFHPEGARAARLAAGASASGMSVFAVGGNLGLTLAPIVVTPLILAGGLAATPWLMPPAWLVAAALLGLAYRSERRTTPGARTARPAAHPPAEDDWGLFRWLVVVVVTRSILYFNISSFIALYVIRVLGGDVAQGAAALALFLGAGVVGTLGGGWVADRFGRLLAVRAGYVAAIPALGAVLLAPSVPLALAASAVLGVAVYLPFSVQTTLGHEYLPNRLGTASGVTLGLAVTVGGAFVPLVGAVADARGLPTAMTLLLVLPVLALLGSTRLRDRRNLRAA